MTGKTIQIFLPDGNPKGVRKASITTDKIEIIQIPRVNLAENRKLLAFNGVYILVDSLKAEKPEIYIGKGDVKTRTSSHDSKKEFWNVVFAIRLKDNTGFNDAHNSYLEYYFVNKAHEIKQSVTTIETLLSTMGLKCFQLLENKNIKKKDILSCTDKYGSFGEGEYTEEGFLLYKGAKCKLQMHKGTKHITQRDELIASGLLKKEKDHYLLQDNKVFSSVSTAAAIVLGRRANGWTEWKNKDGKTLDELERK